MRPTDIRLLLQAQPFRPFRLWVLETTVFEIHHPELAIVALSTVQIFLPNPTGGLGNQHREIFVALLHITRMELIPNVLANGA